jgi:uncharacterized protein involved in outer membrane biogenesis
MNNGLLFLGALLAVILAALFAVPNFVDWNGYRGVFEEEASKVLGRDVRVGGSVNLKLLPAPYVRFEKVRIANLTGQTGEPFVRADSFTMWLSGPALLRGVLEASRIELEKPVLTLAVDKAGGGNWTNIELKSGDLPFVPRDLALRSVKLIDGAVSIYNSATDRVAQIEGIYGELSADSLKGPFRFKGMASWSGTSHDLNFATETPSADGSFGLKVSARADGTPNVYLLDGRVSDLDSKPQFKGEWTGTLAVPGSDMTAAAGKGDVPLLDLKSEITANALGAKIDDITLALDNAPEPQMMTGSAVATWTTPPRLDVTLASKWLDSDWLAGAGKNSASFSKLKQLTLGLMQSVAGDSKASAKIDLQQVKIGGETAGGLSIDADRSGNVTHITSFNVSLPGGSRLDLAGDLKNDKDKHSFTGSAFIGGTSLSRLKAWAGKSGIPVDITSDGPFSLNGKIDIDQTRFALADASAEISGRAMAGDLTIANDGRKRTDLTLQAADLDTHDIFPKTADAFKTEFRKALGLAPSNDAEGAKAELPGDMRLRVIAGRLIDGDDTYRDVDVTFDVDGKDISLPAAKLTTANGLTIGLEGGVKTGGGAPVGTIAYDLTGATPDAMKDLVRKAGLTNLLGDEPFKGLKAGKLAGLIELGRRIPSAADITVDGTLNGSHLSGSAEFDGGLGVWRSQPSRMQITLSAPSLPVLLTGLGQDNHSADGDSGTPAEASLVAAGTFASGTKTRVEVHAHGLQMAFAGDAVWPEDSPLALNGSADIKAYDFADALSVAGLSLAGGENGVATHGTIDVSRDKGAWNVATRDLSLGTATIAGDVRITARANGGRHIEGKIGADRVTVASLISMLTDKPSTATIAGGAASVAALESRSIWPSRVFDFDALDGTEADVRLSFASLDLSGNLATRDGEMRLTLAPGKLAINDLSADAAGGKLTGNVSLEKASNGVVLASDLKLDQAKLSSFSPAAKGTATFDLKAGATAQSPAGLLAVMAGSGHLALKDANIRAPAVATVADIVDTVLQGKMQNDVHAISTALLAALDTSEVAIGDRELAMTVTGGSVKFDPLALDAADGKLEATVSADLTSLNVSAAYQVNAIVRPLPPPAVPLPGWQPPPPKAPLPPAVVLYEGQLDNLAGLNVSVDVADVQRELSVRQVERNVEELEISRRVDEERARLDKERRKAAARAKKQPEQLPPVLPESAGTAPFNANPPDTPSPPDAQPAPQAPVVVPQADQQDGAKSADAVSANTVQTPKITVEPFAPPVVQTAPGTQGASQNSAAAINPETGLPIVQKDQAAVRPVPAPRPAQRPQRRRTSQDEVMKSLGNF